MPVLFFTSENIRKQKTAFFEAFSEETFRKNCHIFLENQRIDLNGLKCCCSFECEVDITLRCKHTLSGTYQTRGIKVPNFREFHNAKVLWEIFCPLCILLLFETTIRFVEDSDELIEICEHKKPKRTNFGWQFFPEPSENYHNHTESYKKPHLYNQETSIKVDFSFFFSKRFTIRNAANPWQKMAIFLFLEMKKLVEFFLQYAIFQVSCYRCFLSPRNTSRVINARKQNQMICSCEVSKIEGKVPDKKVLETLWFWSFQYERTQLQTSPTQVPTNSRYKTGAKLRSYDS